jgi:hypothetical protein
VVDLAPASAALVLASGAAGRPRGRRRVSLFQALTSVQEQTMSMVPKMLAVIFVALVLLAPALGVLRDYAESIFARLNTFGLS